MAGALVEGSLGVNKKQVISLPIFNYAPSGHKLRTTIILCSDDNQSSTFVSKH